MRDEALWRRIQAHGFPPEPRRGFFGRFAPERTAIEPRLEREEGWEASYAEEAVQEYLRFVYLARVSDRQATPSEVIDKVWHAHMTDSHDYIEKFCLPLFGAPLHHEPCTGPSEMPRYEEQYAATLALYREEFGREPPEDTGSTGPRRSAGATGASPLPRRLAGSARASSRCLSPMRYSACGSLRSSWA